MSDEPRLVDDVLEEVIRAATAKGLDRPAAEALARQVTRGICKRWGGGRHYIHADVLTRAERMKKIAQDHRPPQEVASEWGVSVKTVNRIRGRRVYSDGVRTKH